MYDHITEPTDIKDENRINRTVKLSVDLVKIEQTEKKSQKKNAIFNFKQKKKPQFNIVLDQMTEAVTIHPSENNFSHVYKFEVIIHVIP